MANFFGILIRRERLKQNLSQEGLCRGICAVSYLSKIEQGKAEAGDDILAPLLQRLGITYERDKSFLAQTENQLAALYEELFSGMVDLPAYHEKLNWLMDRQDRCLLSPYTLDTMLLLIYFGKWNDTQTPEEFIPCMTRQQYEFYLLLKMKENCESNEGDRFADELLRLNPNDFYTYTAGTVRYWCGRYMEAISLLCRSYDLAAQEGNIYLMVQAKLFLGNCYSDTGQQELMLEQYRIARKLAHAVGSSYWISTIDYNIGSTYLEWGMAEEAYTQLQAVSRHDALYYHKLSIALERLGRKNEALTFLTRARAAAIDPAVRPVMAAMLDLVEYRLRHPQYLHDKIYLKLMEDTFTLLRRTMPSGFVRFHVPYMLEALEAERRYKDAWHLSLEFSSVPHFLKN